jgi:hypothetical protein
VNRRKADNTAARWEKKDRVLTIRVGDTVIRRLSGSAVNGKELSPAQAARRVLDQFLAGRLVAVSNVQKTEPKSEPQNQDTTYAQI